MKYYPVTKRNGNSVEFKKLKKQAMKPWKVCRHLKCTALRKEVSLKRPCVVRFQQHGFLEKANLGGSVGMRGCQGLKGENEQVKHRWFLGQWRLLVQQWTMDTGVRYFSKSTECTIQKVESQCKSQTWVNDKKKSINIGSSGQVSGLAAKMPAEASIPHTGCLGPYLSWTPAFSSGPQPFPIDPGKQW